jgi:transposase
MDSTLVRAHQHSAGNGRDANAQAIGRSKGGLSTKIQATTDALGHPTVFHLTPGQAFARDEADVLLEDLDADWVLVDKGDDADERVIERLKTQGKTVVIPPQRNRKSPREYDKYL